MFSTQLSWSAASPSMLSGHFMVDGSARMSTTACTTELGAQPPLMLTGMLKLAAGASVAVGVQSTAPVTLLGSGASTASDVTWFCGSNF